MMAEQLSEDANVCIQFARAVINAIDEDEIPNATSENEIAYYNMQMAKFALKFAENYTTSRQPIDNNTHEMAAQQLVNDAINMETARAVITAVHGHGVNH